MKSVLSMSVLIFLAFTINAQSISFNALKEAALGNEDVMKRELIENGWTMEQIDKDDEESYGYAYKNMIGLTSALMILMYLNSFGSSFFISSLLNITKSRLQSLK